MTLVQANDHVLRYHGVKRILVERWGETGGPSTHELKSLKVEELKLFNLILYLPFDDHIYIFWIKR